MEHLCEKKSVRLWRSKMLRLPKKHHPQNLFQIDAIFILYCTWVWLKGLAGCLLGLFGMQLKNYLTWRILLVTALCLLVFTVIAIAQAIRDIRLEGQGARQLQLLTASVYRLQSIPAPEVPAALVRIGELAKSKDLRHVQFELRGADGSVLVQSMPTYSGDLAQRVGEWLAALNHRIVREEDSVSWTLARADGQQWHVLLRPNMVSEQEEAAENLIGLLAMLLALSIALVAGTTLAIQRALRPISQILAILTQMGRRNYAARIAPSPIREIRAVEQAINQLAQSLAELEASRKMLSIKLLSVQEEERTHLARELHDELGQKLTIIRLNAGYLAKTSGLDKESRYALSDIADATASIQQEVRDLLGRLRPDGPGHRLDVEEFARLVRLLVDGWRHAPGRQQRFTLDLRPGVGQVSDGILLALYRMTQEALTNIARHASANDVSISIVWEPDSIVWTVRDDGCGIDHIPNALRSGNGLVGMRERVWSLGGTFEIDESTQGMGLLARIPLQPPQTETPLPQEPLVYAMT